MRLLACLIVAPQRGYDEPATLSYAISSFCPTSADGLHLVWEYSIAAKWLELLKEIAPHVTRAMVFRESAIAAGPGQFGVIQAAAPSLGVDLRVAEVRDAREIERAVTTFTQGSNGGLIVTGGPGALIHRTLIVALAARHRLPAVNAGRVFAVDGGLISYGPYSVEQLRRAA